jgi:hypothetical protein
MHHSRQSKHRPDLEEIPRLGDAPFAARGVTFGCYSHVGVECLPGFRLEMANTKRSEEEDILDGGDEAVALCVVRRRAYGWGREVSLWVSHKLLLLLLLLLLAGLRPNRFLLAPPWMLGVVTLCGGPESFGSNLRSFCSKTPVLVSGGTWIRTGHTMIFS